MFLVTTQFVWIENFFLTGIFLEQRTTKKDFNLILICEKHESLWRKLVEF